MLVFPAHSSRCQPHRTTVPLNIIQPKLRHALLQRLHIGWRCAHLSILVNHVVRGVQSKASRRLAKGGEEGSALTTLGDDDVPGLVVRFGGAEKGECSGHTYESVFGSVLTVTMEERSKNIRSPPVLGHL